MYIKKKSEKWSVRKKAGLFLPYGYHPIVNGSLSVFFPKFIPVIW